MATRTISTRLAIEGESQYKQAIAGINAEIGNLNSKLKLVQSEFQNHQNSMEALQAKAEALKKVQEAQSKSVDTLKAAYDNAKAALDTYEKKSSALKNALEENKTALSALDSKTKEAGKEWADYANQASEAEKKLEKLRETSGDTSEEEEKLQSTIDKARKKMQELENETDGAAKTAGELLQQQKNLSTELEKSEAGQEAAAKACNNWEKKLNSAQIQLNNTNAQIELNEKYLQEASESADGCAKSIDEFGKQAKDAGDKSSEAMGTLAATLASAGITGKIKDMADALYDCAVAAGEFHAQMSAVESISGASAADMVRLTSLAKEMGATTQFTANQAGEALEYMAMAGWDASKMMDGLAGIMNLAASSGEDLGTTSDIVTDALTAFKMSADESGHFADVLAQASASANTNVGMLGESFKYVAPLCGTLGYSAEDASIALGLMANAGIKGSQAGTSLKTALANMAAPTDRQAAAMEDLGISLTKSSGEMFSLRDVMDTLRGSFSELDSAEQAATASIIFGKEAMSGMLNIINASEDDYAKLTKSIDTCSGAAERMAAIRLDNYEGQITLLESATEGLSIAIGEALTPALGEMAEMAAGAASVATEFVSDHPEVVSAITAIVVALGALAAGITVLSVIQLPALTAAFTAVSAAMTANPIGMVITGVVALTAGIATLVGTTSAQEKASDELAKSTESLTEQMKAQKEAYEALTEENAEAAKHNDVLADSLDKLISKTGKEAADREKIKYVVAQLNEAVPDLALAYDEETDSLNMTTEELNKYLDAASKQSQYDADVERMNELYAEQAQIQDQLTEAQHQLMDAQVEAEEANRKYGESWAFNSIEWQNAQEKAAKVNETIEELTQKQEENAAALAEAEGKVNTYAASMEAMEESNASAEESVDDVTESVKELDEAYVDAKNSALESLQKQMNLWDEAADVTATSAKDMMSALKSQKEYWEDYGDNLEKVLSRNVDGIEMFVQSVDDGSADAAAYLAGMAKMSDEELQKLVDAYVDLMDEQDRVATSMADLNTAYTQDAQEMADNTKSAVESMDLEEEAKTAGENTRKGYTEGLTGKQEELNTEMKEMASGAMDAFQGKLEIHSPSAVFERFGSDTIQGYINGTSGKKESLLSKMGELATSAIGKFFGISNEKSLQGTGKSTIQGYIDGSNSKNGALTGKMQTLAQNAITKFKNNATQNSLSASGKNSLQGYIDGAASKSSSLNLKMLNHAKKAISNYKNGLTSLYSAGSDTLQGYMRGLDNKASSLYTKLRGIASSAMSAFKQKLGIASPSKEFRSFGINTMEGYEQGNKSKISDVERLMRSIAERASNQFSGYMKLDNSAIEQFMEGIDRNDLASKMTGLAQRVANSFNTEWNASFDMNGAMNGAMSKFLSGTALEYDTEALKRKIESTQWSVAFSSVHGNDYAAETNSKLLQEQITRLEALYQVMSTWLPQLANMKITLNKDTVVGELTPDLSAGLEWDYQKKKRGG